MDENKNNTREARSTSLEPIVQRPLEATQHNKLAETPPPGDQLSHNEDNRSSKWRLFFKILGVLQVTGVAIFLLVIFWAMQQARAGVSGTEFIGILLFTTLVPVIGIIALINLIGLPFYLRRFKPRGKELAKAALSLCLSGLLFLYGVYSIYQLSVGIPQIPEEYNEQLREESELKEQNFAKDNASPEITKEEAIRLLKSCELEGFYYTKESEKEHGTSPATSATGVVLTKIDGEPYRISIADRLVDELVPIARKAQKTCGAPQFWHNGAYEQFKNGNWYFKGEVVNNMQEGFTKEAATLLMQECKADYFVGYTDIERVKDAATQSWLEKAEQSSSGLEISEGSTTYVFASKLMTSELQDSARQFRQACYDAKKLYIAIDDWIETEYPAGQWTRVTQQ